MADDPGAIDDPGDAGSRMDDRRFHVPIAGCMAASPEYAHAQRQVPTGGWRPDRGEIIVYVVGYGIIVMVLAMRLLGYIEDG